MPRLIHTVPMYRRHRGSNQAAVTLNGRDYYLGPHGTKASHVEYDRLIGEWLAAGRQPLQSSGCDLTIAELCVRYWKFAIGYYQAHDAKNRSLPGIKRAMKYLRDRYSRTPAAEFGPLALKSVRQQMVDNGLSEDPWRHTPHHHKTEHTGRERVVPIGPKAQAILFRDLARDPETYCFRPSDSEAKRRASAHAARKTPVSCGNRPGTNRRRKPKHQPGDVYSVDAYRRTVHRACDKAFPAPVDLASDPLQLSAWQYEHRWAPNQLRHAAATEIRKRFGLEAAQTALGHARADVTQVYAERDYALAARVAATVG